MTQKKPQDNLFDDPGPSLGADPFAVNEATLITDLESGTPTSSSSVLPEANYLPIAQEDQLIKFLRLADFQGSFGQLCFEGLTSIQKIVGSERASLLELNHQTDMLFFRAASENTPEAVMSVEFPSNEGVAGFVVSNRSMINLNDLKNSHIYLSSIQNMAQFEAKSLLAAPIMIDNQLFAVIELIDCLEQAPFSFNQELLFESLTLTFALFIKTYLERQGLNSENSALKEQSA